MFETPNILETIAEVAIAITGFTAIAAVFRRRQASWSSKERLHFLILIRTSIIVLFFSFVPWLLGQIEITPDMAWRASCGLFGVAQLADVSWYMRNAADTPTTKGQSILAMLGFANVGVQFLAAAGGIAQVQLVFVAGLILLLYVSIHNFVLLLVVGMGEESTG
ncbi:MAG: hypothetical protein ACI88G_001662 [Woeseiaceae bacterium]